MAEFNVNYSVAHAQYALSLSSIHEALMNDTKLSAISIQNIVNVDSALGTTQTVENAESIYAQSNMTSDFYKKLNYSVKDRMDFYVKLINNSLATDKQLHDVMKFSSIWSAPSEDLQLNAMFENCAFTTKSEKVDLYPKHGTTYGVSGVYDAINDMLQNQLFSALKDSVKKVGVLSHNLAESCLQSNDGRYNGSMIGLFTVPDKFNTSIKWCNPYLAKDVDDFFKSDDPTDVIKITDFLETAIITPYSVLMDLYRFYLLLKNLMSIDIEFVVYQTQKESFFNVKLDSTNRDYDMEIPYGKDDWPKKTIQTMTLINSVVLTITQPIYTYKSISNLKRTQISGKISTDNENQIKINNIVFQYRNDFCSVPRTFSNTQDGSNGIFSLYITAYEPDELTPFDKITLNEIQNKADCISGHQISLEKIMSCIDYIFYSWLTNIKTTYVQVNICHSNCHSNRYGVDSTQVVCVCGRWVENKSTVNIESDTPSSILPPNRSTMSSNDGDDGDDED